MASLKHVDYAGVCLTLRQVLPYLCQKEKASGKDGVKEVRIVACFAQRVEESGHCDASRVVTGWMRGICPNFLFFYCHLFEDVFLGGEIYEQVGVD